MVVTMRIATLTDSATCIHHCYLSLLSIIIAIHHLHYLFIHSLITTHSVDEFMDSRAEAKRASEERMAHLRLVDEKRDRDREGIRCDNDDCDGDE